MSFAHRDAYAVLQVDRRAEHDVIRASYRALARRYHPDGDCPDTARMTELNAAYEQLKSPELRRRYDERPVSIAVGPGPTPVYDPWTTPLAEGRRREHRVAPVLDFGRYAGWTIKDIARHDPDYLRWLSRHSTGVRYRSAIEECLPDDPAVGRVFR